MVITDSDNSMVNGQYDKKGEACLVAHCERAKGFDVAKTVAREVSTA